MAKYLTKPCVDVRFSGFYVTQYQNPEDGKWYLFAQIQSDLIDEDGNQMPFMNSTNERIMLRGPMDQALSMRDMFNDIESAMDAIEAKYINGKIEMAGKEEVELVAEGFSAEKVGDILLQKTNERDAGQPTGGEEIKKAI